jgi:hypothetical protein
MFDQRTGERDRFHRFAHVIFLISDWTDIKIITTVNELENGRYGKKIEVFQGFS